MDHTWTTYMQMLTKRMKRIEVSEQIDDAICKWYLEQGKEVPNWKMQKDPQWWVDYLASLDEDK